MENSCALHSIAKSVLNMGTEPSDPGIPVIPADPNIWNAVEAIFLDCDRGLYCVGGGWLVPPVIPWALPPSGEGTYRVVQVQPSRSRAIHRNSKCTHCFGLKIEREIVTKARLSP